MIVLTISIPTWVPIAIDSNEEILLQDCLEILKRAMQNSLEIYFCFFNPNLQSHNNVLPVAKGLRRLFVKSHSSRRKNTLDTTNFYGYVIVICLWPIDLYQYSRNINFMKLSFGKELIDYVHIMDFPCSKQLFCSFIFFSKDWHS